MKFTSITTISFIFYSFTYQTQAIQFERDSFGRPFINNAAPGPSTLDGLMGTTGDQWSHQQATFGNRNYATPKFGDVIYEGGRSFTNVGFTRNEFCVCPSSGTPGSCSCY